MRGKVLVIEDEAAISDLIARPEAPLFIQRRCAGILGTRL